MTIPWLTRPPTAEEVAAHANAHPFRAWFGTCGLWLRIDSLDERGPDIVRLWVTGQAFVHGLTRNDSSVDAGARLRWLPCTAEGIPVCFISFERGENT